MRLRTLALCLLAAMAAPAAASAQPPSDFSTTTLAVAPDPPLEREVAGFWLVFGAMARRDYQSLTAWRETRCTVLGGRLSAQGTTSSRTTTPSGTSTRDDTTDVPLLGLRYEMDGRETFSSGYDTGSRLGSGGRGGREAELARWW